MKKYLVLFLLSINSIVFSMSLEQLSATKDLIQSTKLAADSKLLETCLKRSVELRSPEFIKYFAENGANPDNITINKIPVLLALATQMEENFIFEYQEKKDRGTQAFVALLEAKANPDLGAPLNTLFTREHYNNYLHICEVVEALLKSGVNKEGINFNSISSGINSIYINKDERFDKSTFKKLLVILHQHGVEVLNT